MRLIDADKLWKCETCFHMQNGQCYNYCDHGESYRPAYSKLKIVDAAPVVHGHWIPRMHDEDHDGGYLLYHCSLCDRARPHKRDNYCPECGAKMDEVSE